MRPPTRRTLAAFAALAAAGGALAVLALGNLEENLVYYWTPSDLLAQRGRVNDAVIRVGGTVQKGSVRWDAEAMTLRFVLGERPDANGPSVVVVAKGAPPQMFREGIGCVVEGRFDGTTLRTERLLVKHSNEYRPPAAGEDPHHKYDTLVADPAAVGPASRATP